MDKNTLNAQARILRGIVSRLNNSDPAFPSQPVLVAHKAVADLSFCKLILSSSEEQLKASHTDAAVVAHSFRTKLSSLIQDKNASARLAGITLVKAAVHVGGYEVLLKNGATWTRILLSILTRPSPASTKRLVILVLVQIFSSTHGLPNLTREVTTPALKDFIPATIGLATVKKAESNGQLPDLRSPLLPEVLQAFVKLLPRHPSVFRPHVKMVSEICSAVVSVTSSDSTTCLLVQTQTQALAQRLMALIPRCAAKNSADDEWKRSVRLLKENIVHTADEIFRSVVETINPEAAGVHTQAKMLGLRNEHPTGQLSDGLGLSKWTGLDAGTDRLVNLLQALQAFISVQGPVGISYTLPVDMILNVVERVMNIFPGQRLESLATVTGNPEISRDEREALFLRSGRVQIEALNLLRVLFVRLGTTAISIGNGALEYLAWCYGSGVGANQLRAAYYDAIVDTVQICGSGMSSKAAQGLSTIIEAAGLDLCISTDRNTTTSSNATKAGQNSADAYLSAVSESKIILGHGRAHESARLLMRAVLKHIPAESIPAKLRNLLDQKAILLRDEEAMLASVLNVPIRQPSTAAIHAITPFLAREHPGSLATEAVIRPRTAVIATRPGSLEDADDDEQLDKAPTRLGLGDAASRRFELEHEGDEGDNAVSDEGDAKRPALPAGTRDPSSTVEKPSPFVQPPTGETSTNHAQSRKQISSIPQSPKRVRDDADDDHTADSPKRVKLATFEPAPGPTSVSVITTEGQSEQVIADIQKKEDNDDDDSDDSSIPSIHMRDFTDSEDDEEEQGA